MHCTYLGGPVSALWLSLVESRCEVDGHPGYSRHLVPLRLVLLQRLVLLHALDLGPNQEALERIETLLERTLLARGHVFGVHHVSELDVVEGPSVVLLLDSQVSQDAVDDMQVQRHDTVGLHSHESHHFARVEVQLADAQLLHLDIGKLRIDFPQRGDIGRRAQDSDMDTRVGG